MITDIFTPIGPVVPIFQLKDLLDFESSGILGVGKTYHPKPAAPYIGYGLTGFQVFPLRYARNGAVKMDGNPGNSVGNCGGHVFDGFTAKGTDQNGYRFGGYLGRGPAGTLKKRLAFPGGRTPITRAAFLI
jgi:hypothetical protein